MKNRKRNTIKEHLGRREFGIRIRQNQKCNFEAMYASLRTTARRSRNRKTHITSQPKFVHSFSVGEIDSFVSTMTQGIKPSIVANTTQGIRVDAAIIAQPFREEIKAKVDALKKKGVGAFDRLVRFVQKLPSQLNLTHIFVVCCRTSSFGRPVGQQRSCR